MHLQAVTAIMEMYLRQNNPMAALAVLKDTLKHVPPALPPMSVLDTLCRALSQSRASQDLFLVIDSLLQNKISVSCIGVLSLVIGIEKFT